MKRTDIPVSRLTGPLSVLGLVVAMAGLLAIMQQAWGAEAWHEKLINHPDSVGQIADQGRTVNPRRYEDATPDWQEPPPIDREFRVEVPHQSGYDYREMLIRLVIHSDGRIDNRRSGNTAYMRGHYRLVAEAPRAAVDHAAALSSLETHDRRARSQWARQVPREPTEADGPPETFKVYIEEAGPASWRDQNLNTSIMTSLAVVIVGTAVCLGAMIREAVRQQRLAAPNEAQASA